MKPPKMEALSCDEQSILEDLLKRGYAHAAQSFSMLTNHPVSVEILSVALSGIGLIDAIYYPKGNAALATTDIMGDVGGRSYLLLSESECAALETTCLPTNCSAQQRASLSKAMIMEIDNILSAAMITKLAEALDLQIYGGVPQLFTLSAAAVKKKIKRDLSHAAGNYQLITNAHFVFQDNSSIQPQFIWQFSPDFLQKFKCYTNVVS